MVLYVLVLAGMLMGSTAPYPSGDLMGIYTKEAECLEAKALLEASLIPEKMSAKVTAVGVACVVVPVKAVAPKDTQTKV